MKDFYRKLGRTESPETQKFAQDMEQLNEYQKAAVTDHSRVLLVNAQVGSGKTTVLINKILYLHFVKAVPLESMVVLTFTNKAADEIKCRIREKNQSIKDEEMRFFGTFHGVCRTLLADMLPVEQLGYTRDFSILDTDEMLEVYERIINENELSLKYRNKLRKRIEQYKQGKFLYGNMKKDDDLKDFLKYLRAEKKKCNVMEFDDLIENAIELLKIKSFTPAWIIIDEFQDCDSRQLDLIDCLKQDKTRVFAVGDPNQVIYTWRGSQKDIFGDFRRRYGASELTLPINYRSTATILDAARAFLEPGQTISGIRQGGRPIVIKKHYNTFNEALYLCEKIQKLIQEGLQYSDIAVLYRKQKQSEVFRDVFEKNGIPYEVSAKRTLRDIPVLYWLVRLLKCSTNLNDRDSIAYVLGENRYGLGMTSKQVKEAVKNFESASGAYPEILDKARNFAKWCAENKENRDSEAVLEYYDLSSYLAPTSVSYQEDHEKVQSFINSIMEYLESSGKELFGGIKDFLNNSALYGSQVLNEKTEGGNSVKLMTLHASKGLEFKYVFISGANLGLIPINSRSMEEEEEERRLFFVGITRAKDYLEVSYHTNPDEYGVYGVASPYLRLIPQELIESEDFAGRASSLAELKKSIKSNMENKVHPAPSSVDLEQEKKTVRVYHEKYGEGIVVSEDESNITVNFDVYGEKVFSRMFCPLKYISWQ
ncbi:MAG: ATP-dependent helicase [Caulobacteraceae bacterium]